MVQLLDKRGVDARVALLTAVLLERARKQRVFELVDHIGEVGVVTDGVVEHNEDVRQPDEAACWDGLGDVLDEHKVLAHILDARDVADVIVDEEQ